MFRRMFEDFCRAQWPGARRYWEGDLELDVVAPDPDRPGNVRVAEVKWRRLAARERDKVLARVEQTWARSTLAKRYPRPRFEVFDASSLQAMADSGELRMA